MDRRGASCKTWFEARLQRRQRRLQRRQRGYEPHSQSSSYKGKKGKPGRWVFIPEGLESPQGPYPRGTFGAAPAPVAEAEEDKDDIILPIITDGYEPQEEGEHDKNDIDVVETEEEGNSDEIDVVESESDVIVIE